MAKMTRPRLINKEQAKVVADTGGIIGVWTHLAESPLIYAQNISALVDVVENWYTMETDIEHL